MAAPDGSQRGLNGPLRPMNTDDAGSAIRPPVAHVDRRRRIDWWPPRVSLHDQGDLHQEERLAAVRTRGQSRKHPKWNHEDAGAWSRRLGSSRVPR